MMKDPAMKEMMHAQQRTMVNMMYRDLFQEWGLTAEQQEQFTGLLLDDQMRAVDLFTGEDRPASGTSEQLTEIKKENEERIKALLGDEKFSQYQEYSRGMGDRMQLRQFKEQLAGGDAALQDEQVKQLFQVMKEERVNTPPLFAESGSPSLKDLQAFRSQEIMDKQFEAQEEFNQRVLARAEQILGPEQLKQFVEFQKAQLQMQKFGMKMATEMFGGEAPVPPQAPRPVEPVK
jgi:hypothetical protein